MATVLVIDDDELVSRTLQRALKLYDYQVMVANSGAEGLQIARRHPPDLFILDIMMPGMDGWTTCRRLREISDVPIIMLTARGMESDVVKGLELGADDYIVKPFGTSELLARIHALLRRADSSSTRRPPIYSDNELTIDFVKRTVTVRDKRVDLTPTEFKLLSTFVQNEGRVLPHRFLLTQVWGPEYSDEVNYLKLYVRYLRQKIEKDPSNPNCILTEWGVGYRFIEG